MNRAIIISDKTFLMLDWRYFYPFTAKSIIIDHCLGIQQRFLWDFLGACDELKSNSETIELKAKNIIQFDSGEALESDTATYLCWIIVRDQIPREMNLV